MSRVRHAAGTGSLSEVEHYASCGQCGWAGRKMYPSRAEALRAAARHVKSATALDHKVGLRLWGPR